MAEDCYQGYLYFCKFSPHVDRSSCSVKVFTNCVFHNRFRGPSLVRLFFPGLVALTPLAAVKQRRAPLVEWMSVCNTADRHRSTDQIMRTRVTLLL
jgi:hypothetical protein